MAQKTDSLAADLQHTDETYEHRDERPTNTGNKYYILIPGKTSKPIENKIRNLLQLTGLEEVPTVTECDVILVFCIINSRAGTDIDAAVKELNAVSVSKRAVFMVLHHTFDPEKLVPDSSRYVTRNNTCIVDCLFFEDEFLDCNRNHDALENIKAFIQQQQEKQVKKEILNPTKAENSTTTVKSGKDLPSESRRMNWCILL